MNKQDNPKFEFYVLNYDPNTKKLLITTYLIILLFMKKHLKRLKNIGRIQLNIITVITFQMKILISMDLKAFV